MKLPLKFMQAKQSGFSLVEILVGLAIGLVTTLAIMQVLTEYEGQKRTTGGNTDAQTSGSIALYMIQRRMQVAGFGLPIFSSTSPLDCTTSTFDHDGNATTPVVGIDPVSITDGGTAAGASDIITIRSGTSQMGAPPLKILSVAGTTITVDNNLGCQRNDIALLIDDKTCNMSTVTGTAGTTSVTLNSATGAATNVKLACMGGWNATTYQVVNGELLENGVPIMANIVNIQAQYGISEAKKSKVINWVDASGATWAAPSVDNRNLIKAVRIAVVARNGLREKDPVLVPCANIAGGSSNGLCQWAGSAGTETVNTNSTINLKTGVAGEWQYYRYRVYETTIPLRNVIWSAGAL